jgi:hypothetical protein
VTARGGGPTLRNLGFLGVVVVMVGLAWVLAAGVPRFGQAQAVATPTPAVPTLSLLAPTAPIVPGSAFDLTVSFTSPAATRGAQFGLSFDPRAIAVTGIDEGDYYRSWATAQQASTTVMPGFQVDVEQGWVEPYGIALLGGPPTGGPSGSGVLATVHCKAKASASGRTTITLQSVAVGVPSANGSVTTNVPSVQVTDVVLGLGMVAWPGARLTKLAPRLVAPRAPAPWGTARPWPTPTYPPGFPTPRPTPTYDPSGPAPVVNGQPQPPPLPLRPVPTPVTRDLAPNLAAADKRGVLIRLVDGRTELWLIPRTMSDPQLQTQLPQGARLIGAVHSGPKVQAPPPTPELRLIGPGVDTPSLTTLEGVNVTDASQWPFIQSRWEQYLAAANPIRVPAGAHLRLAFGRTPGPAVVTVVRRIGDRSQPVPVDGDWAFVVGPDPGVFIYDVRAAWLDLSHLEGVYDFKVEVP